MKISETRLGAMWVELNTWTVPKELKKTCPGNHNSMSIAFGVLNAILPKRVIDKAWEKHLTKQHKQESPDEG